MFCQYALLINMQILLFFSSTGSFFTANWHKQLKNGYVLLHFLTGTVKNRCRCRIAGSRAAWAAGICLPGRREPVCRSAFG
jgi:hypothetical protein